MADDRDFKEELNITNMEINLPRIFIEFVEWIANRIELDDLWYNSKAKTWDLYYEEGWTIQRLFEYWLKNIYKK